MPTNVTEVHIFLGMSQYYHRFRGNYANLAKPQQNLIQKDVPFCGLLIAKNHLSGWLIPLQLLHCWHILTAISNSHGHVMLVMLPLGIFSVNWMIKCMNMLSNMLGMPSANRSWIILWLIVAVVEGFRQFHVYLYSSHTTVITDHLVQEHIYKNPQLQATSDVGIFCYKVVISLFSIRRVNSTRLPMLSLDLKIYLAQKMTTLITFSDMLIYLMLTRLLVTSFHMTIQSGNTSYLTNLSQWYHL